MKTKASDYLASVLQKNGVECVFEVAGGMITHLLDSLAASRSIRIVTVHHEQGGAFAADGYSRVTGRPAVAFATSGPGATNLLTGIGSCFFDSVPAVFITGQVNRHELKGDREIRQLGFQETDIVSMAKPITKGAFQVRSPEELIEYLDRAFTLSQSGRPGPVLIDIPMDVQRLQFEFPQPKAMVPPVGAFGDEGSAFLDSLFGDLSRASRPLLLLGRGVRAAGVTGEVISLAEHLSIPMVSSLLAVDAVPFDHPLRVGFIGSYGNRWANLAIGSADCLLVLGSRLDIRQTGADVEGFSKGKRIYHVDCEPGELNNRLTGCRTLVSDLRSFLQESIKQLPKSAPPSRASWCAEIAELRACWPDTAELTGIDGINPNHFMHELSRVSHRGGGYVADVGNHQMWAAQSLELTAEQLFLTSAGMGAMGYALPAAIGASLAAGGTPYVVVAGDGGIQLNIQELQTVVRNSIPLKIVVLNNRCLGMIRQFQDSYFDGRYQSTYWGYSAPDFQRVAEAYGISATTISEPSEIASGLNFLWSDPTAPALLNVMIDPRANAYPKIAFGKPITEMEPHAKPLDMEGT